MEMLLGAAHLCQPAQIFHLCHAQQDKDIEVAGLIFMTTGRQFGAQFLYQPFVPSLRTGASLYELIV